MQRLIYTSHSTGIASPDTLDAILDVSRRNNARDGLTGLLMYHDGNFLQVLEGEPDDVAACYARIQKDRRHGACIRILLEDITSPIFSKWRMAYVEYDKLAKAQQNQFVDLQQCAKELSEDALDASPAVRAIVLSFLSGFREFDVAV